MRKQNLVDPYVYPGTNTLINKFNIKDPEKLQEIEALYFLSKKSNPLPEGNFDYSHLKSIHYHFFHDVYDWAGMERTVDISKDNSYFGNTQFLTIELNKIFDKLKMDSFLQKLNSNDFCKKLSYYFNEINAAHPFREGNGRTLRSFCDALAKKSGFKFNWARVDREKYLQASIIGFLHANYEPMEEILKNIIISNFF